MNKNELKTILLKNNVPIDCYCLKGGFPNETLVLKKKLFTWEVYYSERGKKTGLTRFKKEEDACLYFFKLLQEMLHCTFTV